jgi:hypothetical protein
MHKEDRIIQIMPCNTAKWFKCNPGTNGECFIKIEGFALMEFQDHSFKGDRYIAPFGMSDDGDCFVAGQGATLHEIISHEEYLTLISK